MSDSGTTEATEAPAGETPQPDPLRDALVASIREELGESLLDAVVARGDVWLRVRRDAWRRTAEVLKEQLGFDYFCFLSGIDWLRNTELSTRYENVWAPEGAPADEGIEERGQSAEGWQTGVAGGETRFQVFARVSSTARKLGVTVKADLDDERPSAPSWTPVYRGADWHERETWEMFGFDFDGHPGLRHLYLPGEFEGFPLRKDFPLLARAVKPWPGLVDKEPVPGEDEDQEDASTP